MDENREERFYELMEADEHDAEAQYQIGLCYLNGDGTDKDTQKADTYFRRAAEAGHEKAAALLAQNKKEENTASIAGFSIADLCLMAEEGDADAQYEAAKYFLNNNNKAEAQRYMNMAVQQGHPMACYELAKTMLPPQFFDGCAQDGQQYAYLDAVSLLKNAVDCSCAPAADLLAQCCAYGIGMDPAPEQAAKYFETAIRFSEPDKTAEKMFQLALRFATGDHVEESMGKAFSWLRKAEIAGMHDARERFETERADCLKKLKAHEQEARLAAQDSQETEQQNKPVPIQKEHPDSLKLAIEKKFQANQQALHERKKRNQNIRKSVFNVVKDIFLEICSVIAAIFSGFFAFFGGLFNIFVGDDSRSDGSSGCGCVLFIFVICAIIVLFQSIGEHIATLIQHVF